MTLTQCPYCFGYHDKPAASELDEARKVWHRLVRAHGFPCGTIGDPERILAPPHEWAPWIKAEDDGREYLTFSYRVGLPERQRWARPFVRDRKSSDLPSEAEMRSWFGMDRGFFLAF